MIASIHLADIGPRRAMKVLRGAPDPKRVQGLRHAQTTTLAPLGPGVLPRPKPGRAGMIAAWDDDAAIDAFLDGHPIAKLLDGGYRLRMRPVRVVGEWPHLAEVPPDADPAVDGKVAALTLGWLRLNRAAAFLRASAAAERDALASPGLLVASGVARPPHFVCTFSVWQDVASMRGFVERAGGGHRGATTADTAKPFHHRSAFIRYAVTEESGEWEPPGC